MINNKGFGIIYMNIQYEVDNSKRNIGLDMLRIIAMAMIVAFHYQIHVSNDTAMFTPPFMETGITYSLW